MKFTELPLSEEVLAGVEKAGYTECTDVQQRVLPLTLQGRDVMVQSKTGSGKTAVFLLTILEKYKRNKSGAALIVSPTRELAVQIEEDARLLSAGFPEYRIGCFYGGVGYKEQIEELASGLNLYVGTPGRLLDFASSSRIDFRCFDTVVLDEADRMFDMGFYPDIQTMFSRMVGPQERQTMLFSATLSTRVRNLAWSYMNEPEEIMVQPEEITVKNITQELFHVTKTEKFPLLLSIFNKLKPASCLIFTNTKDMAVEVAKRLQMNGYKAEYLMGDMPQAKRLKTIDRMKEGKLPILVATDVAARGLQIDDLELVVNYDIPEDYENYVHRIGRTARAGKSGKAITLPVEDKSAGFHYRSRRPRDGERRSSSRDYRKDSRPQKPAGKKKQAPQKKKAEKADSDYSKLSTMTLEERMAYYKKEFGSAPGQKKSEQKPKTKKAPQKQSPSKPQQRKAQPQPKPSVQSSKVEKKVPESTKKEVKKGFLARVLAKLRGK